MSVMKDMRAFLRHRKNLRQNRVTTYLVDIFVGIFCLGNLMLALYILLLIGAAVQGGTW